MFKNLKPNKLVWIFAFLLIAAAIFIYFDSTTEERTFKKEIVDIDTAKITSISLYPKTTNHKEVKLFKEENYWYVQLPNKKVNAEESKIKNLINQLVQIKANGIAAQEESKWKDFNVDTSGTRVQVFENGKNTLDIIIGKFRFQEPRTVGSYVRLKGDKIVYEVNNVMDFYFNQKPNDFRNGSLVNDEMNNWKRITFSYQADSSFQLVKDSLNYWTITNTKTDSLKTFNFLSSLSRISGTDFIEDIDPSHLRKPTYVLTIESTKLGAITVKAFIDSTQNILHSSQNADAYFDGNANNLWQKIFVGKNSFK